ncbi:uncharacterized protein JCM6883_003958 [Sporobolomyces salmoneus]|uniref:uncharacterized protein n=1 Tax=Sporobolomyces salmoneus TaxID=183962 RepID=UPI003177F830
MANTAPAAASLLAQKYGQPDPLETAASNESPTSILSSSPGDDGALQSAAVSNADLGRDVHALGVPQSSWMELASGVEGSWRRELSWIVFSTIVMTFARNVCFDKRIFGNYLLHNLAPIERDSVTWRWIFITRIWEMSLVSWVWKRVRGGLKKEGALFGLVYALVSRSGLYMFEHSYFLISSGAPLRLLMIDCLAFLVTLYWLPTFHPSPPSARAPLGLLKRLELDPALVYNLVFAVGLSTFISAFGAYAIERSGGAAFVKANVWDVEVPAYLMKDQLTSSQMMERPTIHMPTLRLTPPLTMTSHLLHAFLSTLPLLALSSFLPTLSPFSISLLSALIIFVPSTTLLNDIFPITLEAATGVGATLALKGLVGSGVISWVIEQLRNSLLVRIDKTTLLVLDDDEQGQEEVVAVAEVEEVEVIEPEESLRKGKGKGGVVKRKGLGGAGSELDADL